MDNSRIYVGQRYVPKVMGEWNQSETYEGLSIVTYEGDSYTSKKRVPSGIALTNEDFWVVTGNYNAQTDAYREEVKQNTKDLETYKDQIGKIDLKPILTEKNNNLSEAVNHYFTNYSSLNPNLELFLPESTTMNLGEALTFPTGFNLIIHLPETSVVKFTNSSAGIVIDSNVVIKGKGVIDCSFLNTNSAVTVTENGHGGLFDFTIKQSLVNSIAIFGEGIVERVMVKNMDSINNTDKYGIYVDSNKRVSITNNIVHDIFGSGIYVTGQYTLKNNCFVHENTVYNIFAQSGTGQYGNGISLSRATDTWVTKNTVFDCNFSCIRSYSTKNVWIKENNLHQNKGLADDWGNGIFVEFSHLDTIVEANVLNKCRIQIVNQHAESLDRGRTICANNIVKSGCILTEGAVVINGNIVDFNEEDIFNIGIGLGQGEVVFDVNCSDNYIYDSKATPTLLLGVGVLNEIPVVSGLRGKTMRNIVVSSNTIKNAKQNVGRISLRFTPVYEGTTSILASPPDYAQVFGNGDDKTLESFYRYTNTSTLNYYRIFVGRLKIASDTVKENRLLQVNLYGGLTTENFDQQTYFISNKNGVLDIKHIRYFGNENKRHLLKVFSDGEYYYFTITPEGGEWTFTIESEYKGLLGTSSFEKVKCSRIDTSENKPYYRDYSLSNANMVDVTAQVITTDLVKTYTTLTSLV